MQLGDRNLHWLTIVVEGTSRLKARMTTAQAAAPQTAICESHNIGNFQERVLEPYDFVQFGTNSSTFAYRFAFGVTFPRMSFVLSYTKMVRNWEQFSIFYCLLRPVMVRQRLPRVDCLMWLPM